MQVSRVAGSVVFTHMQLNLQRIEIPGLAAETRLVIEAELFRPDCQVLPTGLFGEIQCFVKITGRIMSFGEQTHSFRFLLRPIQLRSLVKICLCKFQRHFKVVFGQAQACTKGIKIKFVSS